MEEDYCEYIVLSDEARDRFADCTDDEISWAAHIIAKNLNDTIFKIQQELLEQNERRDT